MSGHLDVNVSVCRGETCTAAAHELHRPRLCESASDGLDVGEGRGQVSAVGGGGNAQLVYKNYRDKDAALRCPRSQTQQNGSRAWEEPGTMQWSV